MAVESSFNPFAQSPVGAQGLMQVMTKVHNDKYEAFGGNLAAFDPVTNLRVGVQVLKECIARAGCLEAGLRFYVGAANIERRRRLRRQGAGRAEHPCAWSQSGAHGARPTPPPRRRPGTGRSRAAARRATPARPRRPADAAMQPTPAEVRRRRDPTRIALASH